jgi:rod shape-determining protein MreD
MAGVAILIAFPVLVVLLGLQIGIVSQLTLLNGSADLILLVLVAWGLQERVKSAWAWAVIAGLIVSFVSGLPFLTPLFAYLVATAIARLLQQRIWQTPVLAMFIATLLATLVQNIFSLIALQLNEVPIQLQVALTHVVVPSAFLNLLLSIPVYVVVSDLAKSVYPSEGDL